MRMILCATLASLALGGFAGAAEKKPDFGKAMANQRLFEKEVCLKIGPPRPSTPVGQFFGWSIPQEYAYAQMVNKGVVLDLKYYPPTPLHSYCIMNEEAVKVRGLNPKKSWEIEVNTGKIVGKGAR